MNNIKFLVFSNNAEGSMWCTKVSGNNWTYQSIGGNCAICEEEFETEEEAKKYIEEYKKATTKYVVFVSQDMYFWYSKMNMVDGLTYQDVGGIYNNVYQEFKTEDEAIKCCEEQNVPCETMEVE